MLWLISLLLMLVRSPEVHGLDRLIELPREQRVAIVCSLGPTRSRALYLALRHQWQRYCRIEQLPPDDLGLWDIWVLLSGRGGGKTRPAAQLTNAWGQRPEDYTNGEQGRIAILARDAKGCRDVMVNGDSGILACAPPWFPPHYEPSKARVTWPSANGQPPVIAEMHSSEAPKTLRGPQFHKGWGDEFAAWYRSDPTQAPEAWSMGLEHCVRLGRRPQVILTSTPVGAEFVAEICYGPKAHGGRERLVSAEQIQASTVVVGETNGGAPISVSRWFFDIKTDDGAERTVVSRWSSERNKLNLGPGKVAKLRAKYGGTRLGRQELDGEILEKVEGALWTDERLLLCRVAGLPRLRRIEVALDPTRSDDPVDECGIMVGALGEDGIGYLLADGTIKASPDGWGTAAVTAYREHQAAAMIYEANGLGRKKQDVIRSIDPTIKWVAVTATEDKLARAQPISALHEQGKIKHFGVADADGRWKYEVLEAELVGWDPMSKRSPNRLDAYVWLFSSLMLGVKATVVSPISITKSEMT